MSHSTHFSAIKTGSAMLPAPMFLVYTFVVFTSDYDHEYPVGRDSGADAADGVAKDCFSG